MIYSLVFVDDKLFSCSKEGTIKMWDFNPRSEEIFKEIARLFESQDPQQVSVTMERFSTMPQNAREQIYGKLHEIIKDSITHDSSR